MFDCFRSCECAADCCRESALRHAIILFPFIFLCARLRCQIIDGTLCWVDLTFSKQKIIGDRPRFMPRSFYTSLYSGSRQSMPGRRIFCDVLLCYELMRLSPNPNLNPKPNQNPHNPITVIPAGIAGIQWPWRALH